MSKLEHKLKIGKRQVSLASVLVILTILITLFGMSIISVSGAAGEAGVNVSGIKGKFNVSVNNTTDNVAISGASIDIYNGSVLVESGTADGAGTWLSSAQYPWNYTVNASYPGYTTNNTTANITAGEIVYVNLTLNASKGRINITVRNTVGTPLEGASTFVFASNGVTLLETGTTDAAGTWLSSWLGVGVYIPEAAATGYVTDNTNVNVTALQITYVNFTLSPSGTPGEDEPSVGGGGGGAAPRISSIRIVNYEENVSIKRGASKMFLVTVENDGYLRLNNVALSLDNLPGRVDLSPARLEYLDPGVQQVFLVDIYAFEDAEAKLHKITLNATSDEAYDTEIMRLDVVKLPVPEVDTAIKDELDNLKKIIDAVWNEVIKTQQEGKDVTEIFRLLNEANDALDIAENYWKALDYAKAREKLEISKAFVKSAVLELTKIRSVIKEQVPMLPLMYIGAIGGVLVLMFVLLYLKMIKYEQILNLYGKVRKYRMAQKRKVLARKLKALEEGYKLGYIEENTYLRSKKKIQDILKKMEQK